MRSPRRLVAEAPWPPDGWPAAWPASAVGVPAWLITLVEVAAVVVGAPDSDGNSLDLDDLPSFQAGSCGGCCKVGQAVNVEDGSADLTPGNSEAVRGPGDTEPGMARDLPALDDGASPDPGVSPRDDFVKNV
ncbi:hypothetical protein [Sorangium sp. So ce542]|uniref:hypothetical protein n=1 Tax=Sorangium sp. So ce542 TaxID=3133316 RepID=UPI003F614088